MKTVLIFCQVMIFIFGASAIWLVGRKDEIKKWGYVCGLLGQPFWFFSTIIKGEWFLLALTVIYSTVWFKGFYNYWIKKS